MAEGIDRKEAKETRVGDAASPRTTPNGTATPNGNGHAKMSSAVENNAAEDEDVREEAEESVANDADAPRAKRKLFRRPAFLIGASLVILIAAIFGVRYWLYARSHESTDDAFIDGHVVQVSPKVAGYVSKVYVKANQDVKAGDLLAEIDPRDYQTRLDAARAALAAGEARLREAHAGVSLTRASATASVRQAAATVQQARAGVESQRAAAAAERTRITQASSGVSAAEANVAQARSQVAAAEAEAARASADVQRYQELFAKDEISQQRLDQAVAASRTANAQVEAARGRVSAVEAQVAEARAAQATAAENARKAQTQVVGTQAGVNEALGRLAQANTAPQQVAVSQAQAETAGASIEQLRSAVEQAELELSYTKIYAPESGRVTNKSVEEGALVQVGQPLLAVVPGDVWVTANFKESQLGHLRPNEPVEISVDAYPDKTFKAHVESIQAGTGSRFSMLPAENATGNYVKVVQRVPVKIVFDPDQLDAEHVLAPGMSVVPEVQIK